ncbi:MAG: exo-alpha-sialidase [Planctomycetaceae bacterium]|nr:exo-alpha-sialidase [Planctomycetaceae bacterium]MCA9042803.1 exo-alpha-sialidase [Planctomycetaceae bacterium]MCB9949615.1 exo-alpha-sialidase [Planctomycetaceae bacterium]
MIRHSSAAALVLSLCAFQVQAQSKHVEVRPDIPFGGKLNPRQEEPVFAVCSKQGMRILVSRDDGKTWEQTFLGTDSKEDGGWHGTFAVYGMAATDGVIGAFSGWGTPGVYIGSDDGVHWTHLNAQPAQLGSTWSAAGGNGVLLTSADMWRGMTSSSGTFADWQQHSLKDLLAGGKTHHMICCFGDYEGGRFLIVGDGGHVFYSDKTGQNWQHSLIPNVEDRGQEELAYGNGVFVCSYKDYIVRSEDGGKTWTQHDPGLKGWGHSWRGLSFVRGEFWLTAQKGSHGRKSRDGINWKDLPKSTPGGRFVESDGGTLINVERRRYDIKRSQDGMNWETVFAAPVDVAAKEEDVTWDTTFAVFQKVNKVK